MISLFIDTSSKDVSIALKRGNSLINKITESIPNKHSIYTVSFIKKILDDSKLKPNQIDRIYVINGPGSFTGIRIGVTIAKTYAYLLNIEVIPVSSLKELAISSNYDNVLALMKATNKTFYFGLYNKNKEVVVKEQFATLEDLIVVLNKYNPIIISNQDISIEGYKIEKVRLDILKIINYYNDKESLNPHQLLPNYLKLPQALEERK